MNQFGLNSRRSFLKGALLATASGAAIASAANADQGSKRLWTMVIDLNKCIGCQSCTMACKAESGASPGIFYTRVLVDDSSPSGKIFFLPAQCRHCGQPACLPVCASGAIVKQADGIVVTDWDACGGDGACVRACPHSARSVDAKRGNKADSCDFCLDRIGKGRQPACVEACSSGARVFGDASSPSSQLGAYLDVIKIASAGSAASDDRVVYVPLRQGGK